MNKPFSQACENNQPHILRVLKSEFKEPQRVLEVGSGTGQHAAFFSNSLPHVIWQPSDRSENLAGIKQWCADADPARCLEPIELDVMISDWPVEFDSVFTANTLHIMPWKAVEQFLTHVSKRLPIGGKLIVYGAFKYAGQYTSKSNERFNQWLRANHSEQGIRDFEKVNQLCQCGGLELQKDYTLPANNQMLVWQKASPASMI